MANAFGGSIEAVLSLNAQPFNNSINSSISAVEKLVTNLNKLSSSSATTGINQTNEALINLKNSLEAVSQINNKAVNTFNKLANAIHKMSLGFQILNSDTVNVEQATNTMNNIFKAFQGVLSSTYVKVDKLSGSYSRLDAEEQKQITRQQQIQQALANQRNSWVASEQALLKMGASINQNIAEQERLKQALAGVKSAIITKKVSVEESLATLNRNRTAVMNLITGNNQLSASEEKVSASTTKATASTQRQAVANRTATVSTNQLTTATSRLGKAMSSLRMMGSLVGSMLAYNFAHKLLVATGETIHAKSEMEGYFKMLNFGQGEINKFNNALDQTVQRFQRVNKYSLGETISSIGVEFNLTTDEMIKAMDVTSMITSEYLRAGRNANEASLAVKDVLQGQFQRLSRETGVKGEQLKDAGWNGDVTDVNSLLDALRKVGEDRNWDVFAEKANSLNDILTILQNRFGEWSAEMVNIVQPSIVGAFNAIMSVAGGLSNILGGLWDWLNTDGWGQTAVKIGAIGTALLTVTQAFTMYRTGMGMVQIANQGVTKTIAQVILGLKGQQVAEVGVRNSILAKILGVKAETIAERGVASAIREKTAMDKLEAVQNKLNTMSTEQNTVAKLKNKIEEELATAIKEKKITVDEAETIQSELNTIAKDQNTLATFRQIVSTEGLIPALFALGTEEGVLTAETGALSTAWGVLNGVFMLSPIGWITAGILAIAGAVFVLTGGLDSLWGSLQNATKAVDDAQSAMQPYKDYVEQTNTELQEAKEKYGENSLVVQQLSKKYDTAKDSMDRYYEQLQRTTNQHSKLNDAMGTTSAELDSIMREKFGDMGYDQSQIDAMTTGISDLDRLRDHDYVALQKHNKMLGDFGSNIEGFAKIAGDDTEAVQNFAKTYSDFVDYADKANTSDNWWDWATNSVMAGVSERSLDFQKFMKGDVTDFLFGSHSERIFDAWKDRFKGISDWGKGIGDAINGFGDAWNKYWADLDLLGAVNDAWSGFSDWVQQSVDSYIVQPLSSLGDRVMECINNIATYDYIGEFLKSIGLEDFDLMEALSGWFSNDYNGMMKIDTTWISNIALSIIDAIKNFDWANAVSGLVATSPLMTLINSIFGTGDGMDTTWAWDFLNNNIITPIQTQFNMFLADPLSYIGGVLTVGMGGLINALIPDDGGVSILNYVNTSIIQPFTQGIQMGIASIPILGDIAQMLGLVPQQNENARQTGYNLLDHLKQGVEQKIREIPIIGDIAQMLGLIPQQNGNAHDKGHGIGENIKEGEKAGHQGIADNVRTEMGNVISAISQKAGEAYAVAHDIGSQILNGIKNALDMHSPSIISRELIANEFGVYIPQAISNAGDVAYQTAYNYGSQIKEGISAVNTDVGLGGMVQTYESDAQMVAQSSQLMGTTTTTAFNDMSMAVNSSTSQMGTNVATTYSSMQTKQSTALNSMKQKNLTAYNDMYTKSNQSLIQMRDSTSNITHQMTNAWDHMKNQIVASANRLKHDSTVHFNQLSNTIGSFYRKIQNPSSWGAGTGSSRRPVTARRPSVGRRVASSLHGAGSSGGNYRGSSTLTISQLKKKLCPNGDCGTIFDGFNPTDRVDVQTFINSIQGEHGFGSWSSWNGTHYNHIKNKSDQWGMKSPTINLAGGIPTNANYKVGDFENGQPKISFASFQSMAESIFDAIPYRHYYDSSWKGSWLGALQAGACNCSDGADALIAFAGACGFGGHKVHGTWDGEGHFWAVINGKPMDTTAWQKGYGWTSPKVHGYGSPVKRTAVPTSNYGNNNGTTVNVTVDMSSATIYGADDLDNRIEEGIDKGLQKHFNDPYTIAI